MSNYKTVFKLKAGDDILQVNLDPSTDNLEFEIVLSDDDDDCGTWYTREQFKAIIAGFQSALDYNPHKLLSDTEKDELKREIKQDIYKELSSHGIIPLSILNDLYRR